MEFGSHRHLLTNLDKTKIVFICVTAIAVCTSIATTLLFLKNISLDRALENEQQQATKLNADLKASNNALDNLRTEFQALTAEKDQASEQRVGAFAKQAAKCIPIMQKFGVQ